MTDMQYFVEYFVEVCSGGAWNIVPDCPPFTAPQEAEAHRQQYQSQNRNSWLTRVTKYRTQIDINKIPHHVKTPGRATVLLPPGLGDIHWVFLKLQGFLAQNGYTGADAWVWDAGGPRRSAEFVSRIPFVRFVDYIEFRSHPERRGLHEFCQKPNPVMQNKWGFDYVIALNGYLEAGLPLESALDGAPVNWEYPILQTAAEADYWQEQGAIGPWILMYFSGLAQMFDRWTAIITPDRVVELARHLQSRLPGRRVLMVGLPWDKGFAEKVTGVAIENMVGKTNPDQYFALLRGADAMIGFANGNTILTTYFGVPTVMIWNRDRYQHPGFHTNWVGPESSYFPMELDDFDACVIADKITSLIDRSNLAHV